LILHKKRVAFHIVFACLLLAVQGMELSLTAAPTE
jgi:hypothetical protein